MENEFEYVKVGDTVGIRSGTGRSKRVYKLAQVERETQTRLVADQRQFYKSNGREVSGIAYLEVMTPKEIDAWNEAKTKADAEAEERRRNYDPRQDDDPAQAALRSMRDKARSLCELLQGNAEARLSADPSGAMEPHYWDELVNLVEEIEKSENARASVGLSTTLKSAEKLRSLFR